MFTEDYLEESVHDLMLEPAPGTLTFSDLGIQPKPIDVGLPIEHVRHYRVGGESLASRSDSLHIVFERMSCADPLGARWLVDLTIQCRLRAWDGGFMTRLARNADTGCLFCCTCQTAASRKLRCGLMKTHCQIWYV